MGFYGCDGVWSLSVYQKRHHNLWLTWIACFGESWPECLFIYISTFLVFFNCKNITVPFNNWYNSFLPLNIYLKTIWKLYTFDFLMNYRLFFLVSRKRHIIEFFPSRIICFSSNQGVVLYASLYKKQKYLSPLNYLGTLLKIN